MAGKTKILWGPGIAGSQRELAEACGVDHKAVRKWMDKDEWTFGRKAPFKIKAVKEWRDKYTDKELREFQETLKEDKKNQYTRSPLTKARVEGTKERTLLIRQQRLKDAGKLISAEDAQRVRLRQIYEVKGAFLSLPRSIANSLVGKPREKIEDIMKNRIEEIIKGFAGE